MTPGARLAAAAEVLADIFARKAAADLELEIGAGHGGWMILMSSILGRKAGTVEGYAYTPANKNSGITWDEATFREYIKDPRAKIPGTKMIYAGLKDEQRINDLVAFLKQYDATGKKK